MDKATWIHKRKGKYMAQVLEKFETDIEPLLNGAGDGPAVQDFKGLVRARMNALATDCVDLMALGDAAMVQNVAAQDVRDRLHPEGRP